MPDRSEHEQQAYDMGREHALSAASWIIDGNADPDNYRRLLKMMDEGDPTADDYLPARPDLSGEWADGLTPVGLFEEVTGRSHSDAEEEAGLAYETLVGSLVDALAAAYEEGVDNYFEHECERLLRAAIA